MKSIGILNAIRLCRKYDRMSPGERDALRHLIGIGLQHGFPLFIPQTIEPGDPFIACKLIDNGIHNHLDICLEVPVNLFAGCA